ncbi:MAG TPA: hypothetical protein VND64_09455, partial [Pirellulales bacterium]|nr:hypothetical protein [Pirellulales bacterium]
MTPRASQCASEATRVDTASRRDFLRQAGGGLGAIALASLMHDEGLVSSGRVIAASTGNEGSAALLPRPP